MADDMYPVPENAQSRGVTDLTWFAGMAMQGLLSGGGVPKNREDRKRLSELSFDMAELMVKEGTLRAAAE